MLTIINHLYRSLLIHIHTFLLFFRCVFFVLSIHLLNKYFDLCMQEKNPSYMPIKAIKVMFNQA